MVGYCWPAVCDAGPTFSQHCINRPCFHFHFYQIIALKCINTTRESMVYP